MSEMDFEDVYEGEPDETPRAKNGRQDDIEDDNGTA